MKKLIVVLIVTLIAVLAVAPQITTAKTVPYEMASQQAYDFVEELCAIRSGEGTAEEIKLEVINFIQNRFADALDGIETKQLPFIDKKTGEQYVNIEARIDKSGSDKQIVIGAHYDVLMGEGANDNSCGVAALYLTMQALASKADDLPCSVVFVAFDGEEEGMYGSYEYVGNMSQADKDNTLLMFNIDVIATGDNLYLFAENKHTDIANLILQNSDGISEKPYSMGVYLLDAFGYGYYEHVQGSDHTPFRLSGIPTVMFFSGAYSFGAWGYVESTNQANQNMNTANDTFENLVSNTNDFTARIATVSDAIVNTVLDDSFAEVADGARKQLVNFAFWYSSLWPAFAVLALLIILVVLAVLYYRKLQKKAILGTADIKTNKVFEKPDANDIFTFKDQSGVSGDGNKADAEDIFTFKK